jgi:gamma-glutamylputrescine oxidase
MISDSISYWQRTAPTVPLSTDVPRSVDVAVIGGGLMGTATSYWLARRGIAVALLEQEAIGWGATGRNGGFVVAGPAGSYLDAMTRLGHETAKAVMTDTLTNQRLLRQVLGEEAIECDYREPGNIRLALTETQEQLLREEVTAFRTDGFLADFLERETLQTLIKTELSPEIRGGRLKPAQGLIHSVRFVRGLAQAALRRGARGYQASVQSLLPDGDHLRIETSRGTIHAATVVVAVNAWVSKLLPELTELVVPVREQMLAYAPLPPVFSHGMSADIIAGEYFQQTLDGTILIGGCNTIAPGEDIGIWETIPLPIVQNAIETVLPRLFPALAPLQVVQRWAGLLDYTTDRHPIVDSVATLPHVLVVCGLSGHGMPFGLRFGQLLSDVVINGTVSAALKPYQLDRPSIKRWDSIPSLRED